MKKTILLLGVLIALASCSNDKPTELDAQLNAEQYVEKLLKSPGTAEFGTADITELEDGVFKVKSYVDAQNEFGGVVRTNYECTVRYINNGRVKIEDFESE